MESIQDTAFSKANSILTDETNKMFESGLYNDLSRLFAWAEQTSATVSSISKACNGGHVALRICDTVAHNLEGEDFFDEVIAFGRGKGIESKVQTNSKRFTATVVISMYLDSLGLGSDQQTSL
jgi:hypothetical protein